jgi:triphosphoribosyl-dephospho-CoA synthase
MTRVTEPAVRLRRVADMSEHLVIGQCATLACLLEATAPKPGNVHRGADFADLTFCDFAVSAALIGPILQDAAHIGIGRTVLRGVEVTQSYVGTNTNLGTLLLLAPMAAVPRHESLEAGVPHILSQLTPDDARCIYQAIVQSQAGGLGEVSELDIHGPPPMRLLDAMACAAERDLVARQYVDGFSLVLDRVRHWLVAGQRGGWSLTTSIIHAHVRLMAEEPDSLIARKCGRDMAAEASRRATEVLAAGQPYEEEYQRALSDLDFWLRLDGHRRNPGTTADLIAASLFAALRDGWLAPPYR